MSTYNDASLIYYPSGYKESKAYSLKPTDGSGDLTFTRASSATRVNEQGLIETADVILPTDLVINGDFATDSNWAKGTGWTISGGKGVATSAVHGQSLLQSGVFTIGLRYRVIFTISEHSANGIVIKCGGAGLQSGIYSANGTYTYEQVADGTGLYLTAYSAATLKVDNIIVKEVITNNIPRIDYTGGGCAKLLLEPQRTNQFLNSQNAENLSLKSGVSVVSNTTTSPDGTINADSIIESSASGLHFCGNSGFAASQNSFSIFLKANTRNWAYVTTYDGAADRGAYFDLSNGVIGTIDSGVTAKIENYGNGWYRCSVTATTVSVYSATVQLAIGNLQRSYLGNGTSGIYVWGFQLEASSAYPTSYIPTTTTAVTRVKDSFNLNNIYSNGLISASGGTLFIEFKTKAFRDNGDQIVYIGDASNQLFIYGGSDGISFIVARFLGGAFSNVYLSSANTNNNIKLAFKWDGTFLNIFENGVKVVTNNSFTAVNLPNFIGQGTNDFKIQSTMLFPTALSDADLLALTTL